MGRKGPPRKERRANLRDLSIPDAEVVIEVTGDRAGIRLDHFAAEHFSWRSKTNIQSAIAAGRIRVLGRDELKKASRLQPGDRVVLSLPPPKESICHEAMAAALVILFEDEDLLVINKPPGLVVHPVGKIRFNTLIQALHWRYRHGDGVRPGRRIVPKICHRLDKDTSGIIVVAKNDAARRIIQEVFESRSVEKEYRTILLGQLPLDVTPVAAPIGLAQEGTYTVKKAMVVRPDGLPSRSCFRVLRRLPRVTECAVEIETGRQHQIRVHARYLGHPVLFDELYAAGFPTPPWPLEVPRRQALHAARLRLDHPRTGEPLDFRAEIPEDMRFMLARLERQD